MEIHERHSQVRPNLKFTLELVNSLRVLGVLCVSARNLNSDMAILFDSLLGLRLCVKRICSGLETKRDL